MGRKSTLWVVVAAIVLVVAGVLYAAYHKSGNNGYGSSSNTNSGSMGNMNMNKHNSSSSQTASATNSVIIQNFAFSPASITVKKGTTVTWTNKDSATHTVTETDNQTGPNSGNLSTGKSYSFTYDTAGTFKYRCSIHPDMVGTVTVTE